MSSKSNTDLVFDYMSSKYQTWWSGVNGRVGTPERYRAERALWDTALAGCSRQQVVRTLRITRRNYQHSVPRVDQFMALMGARFKLGVPVKSIDAGQFFNHARSILK